MEQYKDLRRIKDIHQKKSKTVKLLEENKREYRYEFRPREIFIHPIHTHKSTHPLLHIQITDYKGKTQRIF